MLATRSFIIARLKKDVKFQDNNLKSEVDRLEIEVAEVRSEAQAAEAHVVQLRQLVKVQAEYVEFIKPGKIL